MKWSDISFAPASRTLRQFAALWLVFFSGLALWQGLVREHTVTGLIFAGLAVAVGPLGLVQPQAIRWVFVAAQLVTFPIGWVVSRVILALLFYGMFTPVSLVFRLLGRDALGKQRKPNQQTYWAPKPAAANARGYFRQF
jgi:Saxitoxin biosynthesis operon protein SxtJ